jgi:hypothetical protein
MAIFRVRVKHEQVLAGLATDGARLNVLSGIYYVEPGVRPKKEAGGADAVLFFRGADNRNGGDLAVKREDYTFLWDFPAMQEDAPLEVVD